MQNQKIFWGGLGAVFLFDVCTKIFVQKNLLAPIEILPCLKLELAENSNLAFGINFPRFLIILLSIFAIAFLVNIFVKNVRKSSKIGVFAFGMVFGGAISNLGERIFFARVTDFVALSIIPNFNLADAALSVGVALLIIFYPKIFTKF